MSHGHSHHHHDASDDSGDVVVCPVMPDSTVSKSVAEIQGLYRNYKGERR